MARKTKVEAEKTRKLIMASALSLFVKKGYDHTTFNDIAARLKMTKGAVYWHFQTKESLLVALVDEMLDKFQRQLEDVMPEGELSFPAIAEWMVHNAERIVKDPKGTAFFMLMKTQIKWADDSMARTREELISSRTMGPYHAYLHALANDMAAGRVRPGVDPEAVATVCISVWDGLVQAHIEKFLRCDLSTTLRKTYEAVWKSISVEPEGGHAGRVPLPTNLIKEKEENGREEGNR